MTAIHPALTPTLAPAAPRRGLRYNYDLISHLVIREFRLRYRRAMFGWLWAIGQPLARLVILTVVFTRIVPLHIPNYGVFLFTGLIAWMWFSSGVASATSSVVDRRDLLFRPGLPRTTVPIVSVLTDGIDYIAALPVLLAFIIVSHGLPATALALPALLILQLLLTLGLGFALCSANVYVRDVRLLVDIILLLGFYVTPVFYSADALPKSLSFLFVINPMAQLITAYRDIFITGQLPSLQTWTMLTAVCGSTFVLGAWIYQRSSPYFVDEL